MSRFMNLVEFDWQRFDGRINFGIWQVQVKNEPLIEAVVIQGLEGKTKCSTSKELSNDCVVKESWYGLKKRIDG